MPSLPPNRSFELRLRSEDIRRSAQIKYLWSALFVVLVVWISNLFGWQAAITEQQLHIRRALADSVGKQDFAARYHGTRIIQPLTTISPTIQLPGSGSPLPIHPAYLAMDNNLTYGSCWNISGFSAQLGLRFVNPILIQQITVDHIAKELVSSSRDAPREILVWGVRDLTKSPKTDRIKQGAMGRYSYESPAIIDSNFSLELLGKVLANLSIALPTPICLSVEIAALGRNVNKSRKSGNGRTTLQLRREGDESNDCVPTSTILCHLTPGEVNKASPHVDHQSKAIGKQVEQHILKLDIIDSEPGYIYFFDALGSK
ncbi:hypothetical protein CVT24_003246 [Panaeolus cyanescens]|uniref:SUN domain-containing protein n=1 Tax=Panaeolus cyanescens TaxID=181874 RepID=A0A409YXK9_9AGAR|nr:hypothetical protein CVT24_003246 [Panaeolus cyanescens]